MSRDEPGDEPGDNLEGIREGRGRYQVTTETSCYLVDFDARTLTRVPDAGVGSIDDTRVVAAALRRDHQPIPLLSVHHLRVGERPVFVLDVRGDGLPTFRVATYVRRIRRLK